MAKKPAAPTTRTLYFSLKTGRRVTESFGKANTTKKVELPLVQVEKYNVGECILSVKANTYLKAIRYAELLKQTYEKDVAEEAAKKAAEAKKPARKVVHVSALAKKPVPPKAAAKKKAAKKVAKKAVKKVVKKAAKK